MSYLPILPPKGQWPHDIFPNHPKTWHAQHPALAVVNRVVVGPWNQDFQIQSQNTSSVIDLLNGSFEHVTTSPWAHTSSVSSGTYIDYTKPILTTTMHHWVQVPCFITLGPRNQSCIILLHTTYMDAWILSFTNLVKISTWSVAGSRSSRPPTPNEKGERKAELYSLVSTEHMACFFYAMCASTVL